MFAVHSNINLVSQLQDIVFEIDLNYQMLLFTNYPLMYLNLRRLSIYELSELIKQFMEILCKKIRHSAVNIRPFLEATC